jgi:hypothetical protein
MTTKDYFDIGIGCVNTLVLIVTGRFLYRSLYSPVDAVKIGRKLNNEQQKDTAKRSLFLTLFSLRGSPVHYDFVTGLNRIDIVFEDTPTVLNAWRTYYDSLQIKDQANAAENWRLQRTELLSEMALALGYSAIRQTDMIRNYYPEGHENREFQLVDIEQSKLAFYKANAALCQRMMEKMDVQDEEAEIEDQKKKSTIK